MSRITRQAVLWGVVFGVLIVVVDTFLYLLAPEDFRPETVGNAACLDLLITCILYYLAGYNAAGITGRRNQAAVAGFLAFLTAYVLNFLIARFFLHPPDRVGAVAYVVGFLMGGWLGVAFGLIGAAVVNRRKPAES